MIKTFVSKLTLAAGLVAAAAAISPAAAQTSDYPNKSIRVIVPYAAGGADIYIRPLTDNLEKKKISLIIQSQVGAGGIVGSNAVKRSEPDGYTLLFAGSGAMTSSPKFQKAEYTLDDFETITDIISIPFILTVQKSAPYQTLKDFIAYAKANPGKINVGTPGVGSTPHLAMEIFAQQAGFTYTHVPYTGVATAIVGLMGGHVDAVFGAPSSITPQVKSGALTALGLSAKQRFQPHPEVPTFFEQGFDVEVVSSFGFLAPKGTPKAIIEKLDAAFQEAAKDPAYVENMTKLYNGINLLGPADYRKALQAESAAFDPVIAKLPKPN